jgi:hypothetical protein
MYLVLNEIVKENWAFLHSEPLIVKFATNEINAKYFAKVSERESERSGRLLPPLVNNGGDSLERRSERFERQKFNTSKSHRREFEAHYRVWEDFNFELPG